MSALVEFLRARLDADAAYVRGGTCNCWQPTDDGKCGNLPDCPRRILAEVEAKRKLINQLLQEGDFLYEDEFKILALPFADHPDYDEAWRP